MRSRVRKAKAGSKLQHSSKDGPDQVNDVEKEVNRLTSLGAEVPFFGKINGKIGAAYVDLKIANLFIELTGFCDIT